MASIQAIPTIYRGVQLKSRLESKCAFLFDKLGWKWQYEPFSVMLEGVNYTPDFYISNRKYVVECRGYETERGQAQIEQFSRAVRFGDIQVPGFEIRDYAVIGPSKCYSLYGRQENNGEFLGLHYCSQSDGWFLDSSLCCKEDPGCYLNWKGFKPKSWYRVLFTEEGQLGLATRGLSNLPEIAPDSDVWGGWIWNRSSLFHWVIEEHLAEINGEGQ